MFGRPLETIITSIPGPGAYNPQIDIVKASTRGVNISSGPTREGSISRDGIPGPGAYSNTIKALGSDVPQYSFRGKIKEKDPNDLPGPGHYD